MEWKSPEFNASGAVKIPERWLHLYYYEALNILFRFENALRLFVYVVLKKNLGKEWDLAALGDGITIRTETKKRISQAREHGYLGYEVSSPMLFLNSGELTQLIVSETYWKYFASYFKATKSIVIIKLQELGTVRNSLAHFRPLKIDDIDLIKQNSRHVLLEVEKCLVQITAIADIVPTNAEEDWYKELKPIVSKNLSVALFSSSDQSWVRVQLRYRMPTVQKSVSSDRYASFKLGTLRTAQLIRQYAPLRESCIYVSDSPAHAKFSQDFVISGLKSVSIVFSQSTLKARLNEIAGSLKDIALKVETETALIEQDHLARGQLVEVRSGSAFMRESGITSYWNFNLEDFKTKLDDIEEVEYWGGISHYPTDFVSSTSNYPWMPSSVSEDEIPF